MKGYELSTDYELLYKLIYSGYRIPAWIVYSDKYEEPIYDLVEVKQGYKDRYSIGSRGRGYSTPDNTLEAFKMNCESLKLKFIVPEHEKIPTEK